MSAPIQSKEIKEGFGTNHARGPEASSSHPLENYVVLNRTRLERLLEKISGVTDAVSDAQNFLSWWSEFKALYAMQGSEGVAGRVRAAIASMSLRPLTEPVLSEHQVKDLQKLLTENASGIFTFSEKFRDGAGKHPANSALAAEVASAHAEIKRQWEEITKGTTTR